MTSLISAHASGTHIGERRRPAVIRELTKTILNIGRQSSGEIDVPLVGLATNDATAILQMAGNRTSLTSQLSNNGNNLVVAALLIER